MSITDVECRLFRAWLDYAATLTVDPDNMPGHYADRWIGAFDRAFTAIEAGDVDAARNVLSAFERHNGATL
jgi:hypothetical protein